MNNINKFNKDFLYIGLIWILFTSTAPFEFYSIVPHHPYKILAGITTLTILYLCCLKKFYLKGGLILTLILIQIIYSLLSIIIHLISFDYYVLNDLKIYFNLFIQLSVVYIVYQFICLYKLNRKIAISLIYCVMIMSILGTITLLLGLVGNIQPYSKSLLIGHRDIYNYILSFSSSISNFESFSIIRSAGYFDEPGTMATYVLLAIILNKIYDYSKNIEKVLVITGFSTLSMAYFVIILFYIFGIYILKKKFLRIILLLLFISLLQMITYTYKDKLNFIHGFYELTFQRFELSLDSDQLLKGNNRSENFKSAYTAFLSAPIFGYGMNAHTNEKVEYFGKLCCNPLHPLATEGIVGSLIFFSIFIYWSLLVINRKTIDRVVFLCWVMVILCLIQRPGFNSGSFGTLYFIFLVDATLWRYRLSKVSPLRYR